MKGTGTAISIQIGLVRTISVHYIGYGIFYYEFQNFEFQFVTIETKKKPFKSSIQICLILIFLVRHIEFTVSNFEIRPPNLKPLSSKIPEYQISFKSV